MGTRSLTVMLDSNKEEICVLYGQGDGYPEYHGKRLAEFLLGKRVVNGIPGGDASQLFNGPESMALSVVSHFKVPNYPGAFYLHAADSRDLGEEYIYKVWVHDYYGEPEVRMNCSDVYNATELFSGTPEEFLAWLENRM